MVCMALGLTGCETGSDDSGSGPVVNYAGTYRNGGSPMVFPHSGSAVVSLVVVQEGDKLLATDNNGANYRGNISGEQPDGLSPFSMTGKSIDGVGVTIAGSFSHQNAGAKIDGNWIEPSRESRILGYSGDAAPAPAATPDPAATPTPGAPTPAAQGGGIDESHAPDSFSVAACDFRDDGDVGGWPITTLMRSVKFGSGKITMVYDDVSWPVKGDVNGNCWLVFQDGGGWAASTFDYLRPNQETKEQPSGSSRGIHSGDRVGVFVSTLARDDRRNGDQRSNIYWVTWP
jgi:hypothetical protein